MNLTIKNSGSRKYPYYRIMNGKDEFCATSNFDHALKIVKILSEDEDVSLEIESRKDKPGKILESIFEKTGINLKTQFSRQREFVNLRFIYCKMSIDLGYTLKETGKIINRDHVSVLHACRKFNDYYQTDPKFRELYHEIKGL
jgi:chromosomal replication initiation ATPase DnaA